MLRQLTTNYEGIICRLKALRNKKNHNGTHLTDLISISNEHLNKLMVFLGDQKKTSHQFVGIKYRT